ncbi:2-C-methyl-D-erythritol 4-phosphate cytidylyltransferase [Bacillus rubiinfantis]|uniref:2-C-methyl-D-erythritol 4-phosphate cytidylyltransferase n=1 Tax=Bacillus rubiinfantis TaxID=1499680 RepID=UPI0005A86918|nr:2-C-methyl-D-erythritol 4-phosphate cytidylyltransferase [Bacillus rubiinfantis]
MTYEVIIPAAGQGKRMGAGKNKLLLELEGIPVLVHTIKVFEADAACTGITLAIHPHDEDGCRALVEHYQLDKVCGFVHGGKERQHSIYNALKTVKGTGIILVHDGARPFIRRETIQRLVEQAEKAGATIVAVPAKDTMKKVKNGVVESTVERESLWAIQTPQAFRADLLLKAYQKAAADNYIGTDDASLVERLGHPIAIVEGDYDNIKLTTPEDLYFAEAILKKRKSQCGHER